MAWLSVEIRRAELLVLCYGPSVLIMQSIIRNMGQRWKFWAFNDAARISSQKETVKLTGQMGLVKSLFIIILFIPLIEEINFDDGVSWWHVLVDYFQFCKLNDCNGPNGRGWRTTCLWKWLNWIALVIRQFPFSQNSFHVLKNLLGINGRDTFYFSDSWTWKRVMWLKWSIEHIFWAFEYVLEDYSFLTVVICLITWCIKGGSLTLIKSTLSSLPIYYLFVCHS